MKEFNLEQALAGKPVVHKDGSKVVKIDQFGLEIVVLYEGGFGALIYSPEEAKEHLSMAEEEMYIALDEKEIKLRIYRHEKPKVGHNLVIFKLVEVF